jgi:perosamine synthetase
MNNSSSPSIPYNRPWITQDDIDAVAAVVRSGNIAGHTTLVDEFEEAIAEYTGYSHAVAVNSATSGLFLAYRVFTQNNYVDSRLISVPTLTFIATANMALARGSEPVAIDCHPDNMTTDCGDVGVSYGGYPISRSIVADDAHYLYPKMAQYKSHIVSVLSTHAIKSITSGEGGVVLTDDYALYKEMKAESDHGRGTNTRFSFGYNFRMPAMNAALALSQLKRHDEALARRRAIADHYRKHLQDEWIIHPPDHKHHSYHLYVIRVPAEVRDEIRLALSFRGIGTQIHYPLVHTYKQISWHTDCKNAEEVYRTAISLPMSAAMEEAEASRVVSAVYASLNKLLDKALVE